MRRRLHQAYERLVLGYPRSVLLLLGAALLLLAAGAPRFGLDASADSLLLENDRDLKQFREVNRRYGSKEFLFVTFSPLDGDPFSDQSLRVIRSLRDAFARLEITDSVLSLPDVPLVRQRPGGISAIADNLRTLESADVDRARAREELIRSPIFRDLIISADGRTTAMRIDLRENTRLSALLAEREMLRERRAGAGLAPEERRRLEQVQQDYEILKAQRARRINRAIEQIRSLIAPWKQQGQLHLGGMPMIVDDMIRFIERDLMVFGAGVFLFLVGMLSVLFRRLRWVVLPLCSCLYAGIVMIGLLGWMAWKVTVISSNFISLMLIITMSMNVHLIVRYRQLHRDHPGQEHRQLVLETVSRMVWPCLYTALTTIIAFCSLLFSGIKPVISFGWMMSIGLCVTFATTFLLFPCLLLLLGAGGRAAPAAPPGGGVTSALARLSERHRGKVLWLSLLLLLASLAGVRRLEVENSFVNYFSDSTEIHQGLKLIDEQLGGTTSADIVLDLSVPDPPGAADEDDEFLDFFGEAEGDTAWLTPDRVRIIKEAHDRLAALPATGKVLSLASVVRVGEEINEGEFDALTLAILSRRIPETLRQSLYAPYIDEQRNEARITLRVRDSLPELRRKALIEQMRAELAELPELAEEGRFRISGLLILYNNMLQSLFQSQIQTLGVVMAGIALMLLVLFRSLILALVGIVPNVLAALAILALMGFLGIPLDMMTVTIAAITIGIAVDNSIHYIYRFREEFPRFGEYGATLHHCHANIGRAVFYTAITIISGFSILVLSNFIPTIYFGLLTALAMSAALLASLTLLPCLLLLVRPFRR